MCTNFQQLVSFEFDGLVVEHVACADLGAFGVEEDAGVGLWAFFEGLFDTYHLSEMFGMVAV